MEMNINPRNLELLTHPAPQTMYDYTKPTLIGAESIVLILFEEQSETVVEFTSKGFHHYLGSDD
ncbi:reverse transcriptase [Gossypium australe]|uniref:Reverse transcriptase n=1 Tax=Gossypium australe TaxID=47621 RepID=A0A5B6VZ97_9ROSI|nr:reverse transcriptase [Gossypium australe]